MGPGQHKGEYYGQQQPEFGGHQGATAPKQHHGQPGMGYGKFDNPQMGANIQPQDLYEKPGQQFKGQPGQLYNVPPQTGMHHQAGQQIHGAVQQHPYPQHGGQPNFPPGYPQGSSQHHQNIQGQLHQAIQPQHPQPIQNQPPHPKKMQPAYEGQTLNPPLQPQPPSRPTGTLNQPPHAKEKAPEEFRQPGYRGNQGQDFQGSQPGFQSRPGYNQPQEPQQYHSKGAKANINNPPSQYYGKGKPDYYKGGYQKPEPQSSSRLGQQQGYYDQYGNYDPYYSSSYFDSSAKSQEFGQSHSGSHQKQPQYSDQTYPSYDKPGKGERKPKQPAATEPTIKKNPKQQPTMQPSKDSNPSKKPTTYEEMMSEKTPKSFARDDRGLIMSEEIGQTTTSWLQGAASPNEKFIDDTVENINRKPGFNRLKKKKFDRDRKLEEYKARVGQQEDEQGQAERKNSDASSQKKSDGGEKQAGDVSKTRNIDPKKRPNLDFGVEIDEGESESHHESEPDDHDKIGEEDEYNEEQELISDEEGEEEFADEEAGQLIPEAKRQAMEHQHQARVAEMLSKHQGATGKDPSKRMGAPKSLTESLNTGSKQMVAEDAPEEPDQ